MHSIRFEAPPQTVEVLSVRKFVTQLVRRLPKNSADAVPEAAERLEKESYKRIFSRAQHWALGWRALALTQVHQNIIFAAG